MSTDAKPRIAILDDYQNIALSSADWSSVTSRADITVFTDTLPFSPFASPSTQRIAPPHLAPPRPVFALAVFRLLPLSLAGLSPSPFLPPPLRTRG